MKRNSSDCALVPIQYISLYIDSLRQSTDLRRVLAVCRRGKERFSLDLSSQKKERERNSLDFAAIFPGKIKCLRSDVTFGCHCYFSFP